MCEFFVISVIVTTIIIVVYTCLFIHSFIYIVHIYMYIYFENMSLLCFMYIFMNVYYCCYCLVI